MAGFPKIDRYAQMVQKVIPGAFYESLGIVVPLRNDPTELRFETTEVSTEFGLYLNEIWQGTVTSDANGNVVFNRKLPKGEIIVSLLSRATGQAFDAYVTVRDWAIWFASYAQAFENIDDNIAQVRANLSISTAESEALSDIYGEPIEVYASAGQGVEAYRHQLHELRMAYRDFGSTVKGLNAAVGAFTQVEPFGYLRRNWGPNWVLDQSMLVNHNFDQRSAQVTKSADNITGMTVTSVEATIISNPGTAHVIDYDFANDTLVWIPNGSTGSTVYAAEGEVFLPGPYDSFAWTLGRDVSVTGYAITAGVNDHLYLNLDKVGVVDITLTTGLPTPSVANVVTDIVYHLSNALGDYFIEYGAAYSVAASSYNGRLLLRGLALAGTGSVEVLNGPLNGAGDIFGATPGDVQFGSDSPLAGVEILEVNGGSDDILLQMGTCDLQYTYAATPTYSFKWKAPASILGGSLSVTESGDYTVTDNNGNELKIHVYLDELPTVSSTVNFTIGYDRKKDNSNQTGGIWVQVDKSVLPGSNQTDTVIVYDDVTDTYEETPDYWFIETPTGTTTTSFEPSRVLDDRVLGDDLIPAFKYRITDAALTGISLLGHAKGFPLNNETPRGSSYPVSTPGFIYDYENYTVKLSCWIQSLGAGAATATLNVSFDGGDNWTSSAAATLTPDTGSLGYPLPDYIEFETPIISDIKYRETVPLTWEDSGVLVRIDVAKAGASMDVTVEGANLQVKYISSGYLGNATVPRSAGRQYLGGLMWVWSKEALTIKENTYLGIPHVTVDKTTPYAGATVTLVSEDTPAGVGTLEYDYTVTGDVRKFRWMPYGTTYGVGVGYTTITSDGTYTLTAPDSSYLNVYVTQNLLPLEDASKSLTVSDETTNVGQTRRISPATFNLDIYDATEYNTSGDPTNLAGVLDEADMSLCGLVNTEIQGADPFKYAYAYPEFESPVQGETLVLALVGVNQVATLDYYSDQNQTTAVLLEDGVPVPNTWWTFSAANQISIPNTYFTGGDLDISSTFTINYDLIYQLTSTILSLNSINANYADYGWWADYFMHTRYESVQGEYETTSPIYFSYSTSRAILTNRSAANKPFSTLKVQQAQELREIPKRYWRFLDDLTLEIDKNYLVNGQYYLDHQELRVYEEDPLTVVFEHRSGLTSVACASATWSELYKNEAIDVFQSVTHPYHQLRLSVSGIRDLNDFKIRSMTLKGLNLRGATPSINGLTNIWKGA